MSFFECFSVTVSTVLILNEGSVLCEIGHCCTLMKTRTAAHSRFDLINLLFFVFPSDIWCKINKLLKYYEYQLTKRCLEGRLEGLKVSSWFLKIMKVVEYRIAKIFTIVIDGCIITIHELITCDSTLMKQSLTLAI